MNSVSSQARRAERHLDSITLFAKHMAAPCVTARHLARWLKLRVLHTRTMFDRAQARQLRKMASDTARNMNRGHFGRAAGFDLIALETRHGGR